MADTAEAFRIRRLHNSSKGAGETGTVENELAALEAMRRLVEMLSGVSALSERDLHILLTRLLYCYFAEDSGVWRKGLLANFFRHTGRDLNRLFSALDTPLAPRAYRSRRGRD